MESYPILKEWDYMTWVKFILSLISLIFVICIWILHIIAHYYGRTHLHRSIDKLKKYPGVSIIKPLLGVDSKLKENLISIFEINYPKYEIIFCFIDKNDSALILVKELCKKYSHISTKICVGGEPVGPNPKINNMMPGFRKVTNPFILISDANIYMEKNSLTDMISCMKDNIGLVTQIPFCKTREGKTAAFEKVFFGTSHARIYLAGNFLEITCSTGMSALLRKSILDVCGGLSNFSQYLAEDYFLGKSFLKKGYKSCISHMPALQNSEPTTIASFNDRICRWMKLRMAMLFHTFLLEPLQEPLICGILGAVSLNYFFNLNILYYIIVHLVIWCLFDFNLLRILDKEKSPEISFPYFIYLWLLRELTTYPMYIKALLQPNIKWKTGTYRLSWGGKIKKVYD
uniref:ceramide glucosyltransferase n=1 Tax=Parastrongyloides trichosuri TaxID=131310 RepID=A0A0N4ZR81_PARTI